MTTRPLLAMVAGWLLTLGLACLLLAKGHVAMAWIPLAVGTGWILVFRWALGARPSTVSGGAAPR